MNLQQKVKEWEQYEGEKQKLLQYLKEAEKELEKPAATTGQDLAEKDLKSKKVCLFLFVVFLSQLESFTHWETSPLPCLLTIAFLHGSFVIFFSKNRNCRSL